MANHGKHKANTRNRRQARENARDQVAIGFGFVSDWLSRWREFFKPIREHSKAQPKQSRITFESRSIQRIAFTYRVEILILKRQDKYLCKREEQANLCIRLTSRDTVRVCKRSKCNIF